MTPWGRASVSTVISRSRSAWSVLPPACAELPVSSGRGKVSRASAGVSLVMRSTEPSERLIGGIERCTRVLGGGR